VTSAVPLLLACLATTEAPAPAAEPFGGFDDFKATYLKLTMLERFELTKLFVTWQEKRGGFPIIEADGSVVFVYVGKPQDEAVRVIGDFRTKSFNSVYWDEAGEPLLTLGHRVPLAPGVPVFWKRMKFEPDARLDYQFVVDGKYLPDPGCPRTIVSGAAPSRTGKGELASELVMPGYRQSSAVAPRNDVPHGSVVSVKEGWATPKVAIYLPPGYDGNKTYPVMYTADGQQWRDVIGLPAILDNVIADGKVEPMIAVMIDSAADRVEWYMFNPSYLAYLEKVVAYVDGHYSTRPRPEARLHAGSSAAGRAGLQVGLARPDLISNLALLSPSLISPPHHLEPFFSGRKRPDRRLKIWLSAGTYEGYIYVDAQLLERQLRKTGVRVSVRYTHEGHSFGTTRNLVPDVLAYFFPGRGGSNQPGTAGGARATP
jgi:enterochelin esterase-like enzyme